MRVLTGCLLVTLELTASETANSRVTVASPFAGASTLHHGSRWTSVRALARRRAGYDGAMKIGPVHISITALLIILIIILVL
ncbi:hypothetical protein [Conexibacter sp. SYSU D00693]|uniref:hypothetical protein n=1 Tax=Conexibacter sp. SYSU D00693 TaxID=2812560 RepID=UPI001F12132A|nr:hypothetical protein [Conexibacter sp. SYSU D00693]